MAAAHGASRGAPDAATLYKSIRGLIAQQNFSEALSIGWELYYQLCGSGAADRAALPGCNAAADVNVSPTLAEPTGETRQRAALVVGAVLNLLMSAVEGQAPLHMTASLVALVQPLGALPAWVKVLGSPDAGKHSEAICRLLLKGAVRLAEASTSGNGIASGDLAQAAQLAVGWAVSAQTVDKATQALAKLVGLLPPTAALQLASQQLDSLGDGASLPEEQHLRLCQKLAEKADSSATAAQAARLLSRLDDKAGTGGAGLFIAVLCCNHSSLDIPGAAWWERLTRASSYLRSLANSKKPQLACVLTCLRGLGALRKALPPHDGDLPAKVAVSLAGALHTAGSLFSAAKRLDSGDMDMDRQYGQLTSRALVAAASLLAQLPVERRPTDVAGYTRADFVALVPTTLNSCSQSTPVALRTAEARWLASSMYNIGAWLTEREQHSAAVEPLHIACCAALSGLDTSAAGGADAQAVHGVEKKLASLARSQQAVGDHAGALRTLAAGAAALVSKVADASLMVPLLRTLVDARQAALSAAASPRPPGGLREQKSAQASREVPTLEALLLEAKELSAELTQALLEEEVAVLCSAAAASPDDLLHRELEARLERLGSSSRRARMLVLQARALQHSGAQPSGSGSRPSELLHVVLEAAHQGSQVPGAETGAAVGAAQALLALQHARDAIHASQTGRNSCSDWKDMQQHAQQAAESWEGHLGADLAAGGKGERGAVLSKTHLEPCADDLSDLTSLSGLQGLAELEGRLLAAAHQLQRLCGSGAAPGVYRCTLCTVICPSAPQSSDQAVSANGHPETTLQRVVHHQQAAELALHAGEIVSAQHDAHEALRLVSNLHSLAGTATAGADANSTADAAPQLDERLQGVSFWRLHGLYAASLLQTGRLMEVSASPEEALWSFQEALTLAEGIAAAPLSALCHAHIAEVHARRGDHEAAEAALAATFKILSEQGLDECCSVAAGVIRARLALAAGDCSRRRSDLPAAMQHYSDGMTPPDNSGSGRCATRVWTAADLSLRLQLQQAKCHHLQGDSAATAAALAELNAASLPPHPVQTAAAAIFSASLELSTKAHGDSAKDVHFYGVAGGGSSSGPTTHGMGKQRPRKGRCSGRTSGSCAAAPAALTSLLAAHAGWHEVPLLRRKAASLLARAADAAGAPHASLLFAHDAIGTPLQQQYATVLAHRAKTLHRSGSGLDVQEARAALASVQLVLQLTDSVCGAASAQPVDHLEASAREALEAATECVGDANTVFCSISLPPVVSFEPAATPLRDQRLQISRYVPGRPPLLLDVPVDQLRAALADDSQAGLSYITVDLRLTDMLHWLHVQNLDVISHGRSSEVRSVHEELAEILEGSDASLAPAPTLETPLSKEAIARSWWRTRTALDGRLAALLSRLDASWLGPWRCLLFGQPADAGLAAELGGIGADMAAQMAHLPQLKDATAAAESAAGELCHVAALSAAEMSEQDTGAVLRQALRLSGRDPSAAGGLARDLWQRCDRAARAAVQAAADVREQQERAASLGPVRSGNLIDSFAAIRISDGPDVEVARATTRRSAASAPEAALLTPKQQGRQTARRRRKGGAATAAAEPDPDAQGSSSDAEDLQGAEPATPVRSMPAAPKRAPPATAAPRRTGIMAAMAASPATVAAPSKQRARSRAPPPEQREPLTEIKPPRQRQQRQPPRMAPLTPMSMVVKTRPAAPAETAAAPARARAQGGAGLGQERSADIPREATLLIVDGGLQALPWESVPSLLHLRIYRMPSLATAAAVAQRQHAIGAAALDLASTFYLLNPSGDLTATQATFEERLTSQPGWQGLTGSAPAAAEMVAALQAHQMFVYLGHGSGEQYLPRRSLARLPRCSGVLLMGCSSGRLRPHGRYEPTGTVLAYLLAGCPTAVANLWDVTDVDIDRFCQAVLGQWLDTADTDAAAAVGPCKELCIAASVAAARPATRLGRLVGAAPVCYGVPTFVQRPARAAAAVIDQPSDADAGRQRRRTQKKQTAA